jgi:hypothetical protein
MMPESWNKRNQRSTVETSTAWKWLSKHVHAATNMHTTIAELLEVVFAMWSVTALIYSC